MKKILISFLFVLILASCTQNNKDAALESCADFNYKKSNEAATYHGNWESQTYSVIFNNPDKRYIRVLGENNFIPKRFSKLNNLTHMSVADFQAKMAS